MRPLSPLEMAAAVAVAGSVLAVAVPSFMRNLRLSRLAEPTDGLHQLATRATAYAETHPADSAFPETAPLTPSEVPRGARVDDPPGTWDHPTWRALEFGFASPHAFSFAFESQGGARSVFHARAHGDLDGDGALSTFSIDGSHEAGRTTIGPLEVRREVE